MTRRGQMTLIIAAIGGLSILMILVGIFWENPEPPEADADA